MRWRVVRPPSPATARDDPPGIGVDDGVPVAERERRDRPRGIRSDALQARSVEVARHLAAPVPFDDLGRGAVGLARGAGSRAGPTRDGLRGRSAASAARVGQRRTHSSQRGAPRPTCVRCMYELPHGTAHAGYVGRPPRRRARGAREPRDDRGRDVVAASACCGIRSAYSPRGSRLGSSDPARASAVGEGFSGNPMRLTRDSRTTTCGVSGDFAESGSPGVIGRRSATRDHRRPGANLARRRLAGATTWPTARARPRGVPRERRGLPPLPRGAGRLRSRHPAHYYGHGIDESVLRRTLVELFRMAGSTAFVTRAFDLVGTPG